MADGLQGLIRSHGRAESEATVIRLCSVGFQRFRNSGLDGLYDNGLRVSAGMSFRPRRWSGEASAGLYATSNHESCCRTERNYVDQGTKSLDPHAIKVNIDEPQPSIVIFITFSSGDRQEALHRFKI